MRPAFSDAFGKAFLREVLDNHDPRRVVVFSRDELKQYEVRNQFGNDPRLRWFLGDVRDERRLARALKDVDYVVHAAALKQVDTAEYNPFEFVKTNILGSQNVIEASIDAGVKQAFELIASGQARDKLESFAAYTRRFAAAG